MNYQKSLRDIWERGRTSEKTVSLHQGLSPDANHPPPSGGNLWTQTPELNRFTQITKVQCTSWLGCTLHTQPPPWNSHHLSLPFPSWMAIRRRLTECPSPRNPPSTFHNHNVSKRKPQFRLTGRSMRPWELLLEVGRLGESSQREVNTHHSELQLRPFWVTGSQELKERLGSQDCWHAGLKEIYFRIISWEY